MTWVRPQRHAQAALPRGSPCVVLLGPGPCFRCQQGYTLRLGDALHAHIAPFTRSSKALSPRLVLLGLGTVHPCFGAQQGCIRRLGDALHVHVSPFAGCS